MGVPVVVPTEFYQSTTCSSCFAIFRSLSRRLTGMVHLRISCFYVRPLPVRSGADHCRFLAFSSDANFSLSSSFMATMTYAMRTMLAMKAAAAPAQVELPT